MDDDQTTAGSSGAAGAWTFPNETRSVSSARRAVQEVVEGTRLEELSGSAALVVTELAANAVLHTHAPFQVWVHLLDHGLRISVADRSPVLPVVPTPSAASMTGRGLLLVRSLAARLGFDPRPGGKVVWAEIRDDRLPGDAEVGVLIDAWADDLDDPSSGSNHRFIELGDVPTELLLAAKSHVDNLVREFTLAAAGAEEGSTAAVPPHLAELIETVVHRFSGPRLSIKRQALAAARQGKDHVRLRLRLEPGAAEAGEAYLQALDEADVYCRAARLLTLETPPKHRVFRHWYVGQIVHQLRLAEEHKPPEPPQAFEDRLLDEIDAVAAAWVAADRAARLYTVSYALTAATTPEEVAEAVLAEGAAALGASGGGLFLPAGESRLSLPGTVGYDPRVVEILRSESPAAELPAAVAMRTGEPVWMESREERDARFPELADIEAETASMCAVPLQIGRRLLGALRFSFADPRLFDEDERRFVLALASQAAQALDRAQLSQERSSLYQRLQHSLLPPALPDVPGMDMAACYHPLGDGIEIGGDFYDVWAAGPQEWAFVLGDVCGTGPEAAGISACVRYTLRGITEPGAEPKPLLERLNQVLLSSGGDDQERFCTVIFGLLRPSEEGFELVLATGGHPEPILQRRDGAIECLAAGGSLLGVLPEVHIVTTGVRLRPGDRLVLYTDGASEARREGRMLGTEGLVRILQDGPEGAAEAGRWLESQVLEWSGGRLQDDTALLVLQAHS